jgi:heat-inducible transcriptional repressor
LAELATLDWSELDREFARYADFLRTLLAELTRRTMAPVPTPIMIRGISEVLRQPEFSELQQVRCFCTYWKKSRINYGLSSLNYQRG